jgi:hypothetical protein
MDAERMNFLRHHITCGVIHQPVSLDKAFATERRGRDIHDKVPATAGGSGVAGMFGAFVDDVQGLGLQVLFKALAQFRQAFFSHQGNTFLNGFTVTSA